MKGNTHAFLASLPNWRYILGHKSTSVRAGGTFVGGGVHLCVENHFWHISRVEKKKVIYPKNLFTRFKISFGYFCLNFQMKKKWIVRIFCWRKISSLGSVQAHPVFCCGIHTTEQGCLFVQTIFEKKPPKNKNLNFSEVQESPGEIAA